MLSPVSLVFTFHRNKDIKMFSYLFLLFVLLVMVKVTVITSLSWWVVYIPIIIMVVYTIYYCVRGWLVWREIE